MAEEEEQGPRLNRDRTGAGQEERGQGGQNGQRVKRRGVWVPESQEQSMGGEGGAQTPPKGADKSRWRFSSLSSTGDIREGVRRWGIGPLARKGFAHSGGLCSVLVFMLTLYQFMLLEGGGKYTMCHPPLAA